ncbi:MAG TPA: thioredoxin domain-containing protein [Ferruginibacter sp.]|nr:thioredoxin domain-containing protein [Ferruginibacter sp.]HMP19490.1 thioredoxin domain-containing protein [Ferruginibacter sp.]
MNTVKHKHSNQLIYETSPYLLQHAHNPVQWYPWGAASLQKAKAENKIILVSIGYAACHWCHVMERESFEDEAVAAIMNENFVNIKIDREERPDIDHIYMDAVQAMAGSGGWPLNVFLTPDAKPFYGGTYFPPKPAYNRPSWAEVLHSVAQAWVQRQHEIIAQAENVTAYLQQSNHVAKPQQVEAFTAAPALFTLSVCKNICGTLLKSADTEWGGFGRAPKFPQTFTIRYLLQYAYHTGHQEARQQALLSINKMLDGGIFDHVAGGLARYSTDNEWLAPHFEKMLYDNALLLITLCDAYQLTADIKYANAIEKITNFISQEMLSPEGGFYAALDADSEGEEGRYYVWQKKEIETLLGADAESFCQFYDITEAGNWEGKNILRVLKPVEQFAEQYKLDAKVFEQRMQHCLGKLATERKKRARPALDDKVLLGWNALMIEALARAATALGQEAYKQMAVNCFHFIQQQFAAEENSAALLHTWKAGTAKYPAFLDDYACLISAAIHLYEATFDAQYLYAAEQWCLYVEENFSDEEQIFFYYTNSNQDDVIVRKKEIYDGAVPSGNAVMASALRKLSVIFNRPQWAERSYKMVSAILPLAVKYPGSFCNWCTRILQETVGLHEIAIVGSSAKKAGQTLLNRYIPAKVIMAEELDNTSFSLLQDKPVKESPVFYLCSNYTCQEPLLSVEAVWDALAQKDKISVE